MKAGTEINLQERLQSRKISKAISLGMRRPLRSRDFLIELKGKFILRTLKYYKFPGSQKLM